MDWSLWHDRERWPFVAPGFVFFPEAALTALRAVFPSTDWDHVFPPTAANLAPVPHPNLVFDALGRVKHGYRVNVPAVLSILQEPSLGSDGTPSKDQWEAAYSMREIDLKIDANWASMRETALNFLQSILASDVLIAAVRDEETHEMKQIDKDGWNCNHTKARKFFQQCRVRFAGKQEDSWIFVHRVHLQRALTALRASKHPASTGEANLPPAEDRLKDTPASASSITNEKTGSGRGKPKWYAHYENLWVHERDRRRRAREENRPVPVWPTDAEFLDAVRKAAKNDDIKIGMIAHHRRETLNKEYGRE